MSIDRTALLVCVLLFGTANAKSQPLLALATDGVAQGNVVALPVWLINSTNLAGLQFEFGFNPQFVNSNDLAVTAISPGTFADGALALSNRFRVVLVSTNRLPLTNGMLAKLNLAAPSNAPNGRVALPVGRIPGHRLLGTTTNAQGVTNIALRNGQLLVGDAFGFTEVGGRVQFRAVNTTNYLFQAGSNLLNWSNLGTNAGLSNLVFWIDADATNFPHRFYRVAPP